MTVTQSTFTFSGNNFRKKSYDTQAFFEVWLIIYSLTSIFQHFLTSNCTSKHGMTGYLFLLQEATYSPESSSASSSEKESAEESCASSKTYCSFSQEETRFLTVKTLNIGTPRPATVVVFNIKQFYFTMK